jgi:hypothetical protein
MANNSHSYRPTSAYQLGGRGEREDCIASLAPLKLNEKRRMKDEGGRMSQTKASDGHRTTRERLPLGFTQPSSFLLHP